MKRIISLFGLLLLLLSVLILPAQTQSVTWTAEYFNNTTLTGPPAFTTSVASPSQTWGSGSPSATIPSDNFSARFQSSLVLSGTYRFEVRADDGVRVYVGNTLLIDQWHSASGQTYTAHFTGAASSYLVRIEYYEAGGDAFLHFNLIQESTIPVATPTTVPSGGGSGIWTAQYYNNASLSGQPVVTQNEASPDHNWGTGAPVAGVGADNFSVRWHAMVAMNGTYRVDVLADDGVRVWVNGVNIIDRWHNATGQTYSSRTFTLFGSYLVVIEYYEGAGNASIDYNLVPTVDTGQGGGQGGGGTVDTPKAVVNVGVLNVRSTPFVDGSNIIGRIYYNEAYPIIGRSRDGQWYQINLGTFNGWVFAQFVDVTNAARIPINVGSLPVIDTTIATIPPATPYQIRVIANLNVRAEPDVDSRLLNRIQYTDTATLLARNASGTWWLVEYKGTVGWVSGFYVVLPFGLDIKTIPVR